MTIYDIDHQSGDVTLKRGDRARWKASDNSNCYTKKGLVESLCADGHEVTVRTWMQRYYLRADVRCSCGHERPDVVVTFSGAFTASFLPVWRSHFNPLAAPLRIWKVESARNTYTCIVGLSAQIAGLMHPSRAQSLLAYQGDYQYCVLRTSVSRKTGKDSSPAKLMNRYNNFSSAVQYAKSLGIREESRGSEITWLEEAPVTKPTAEASAIIAAIDQANDVTSLMTAVKLADSYLDYAKIIEERKEAALQRFHELTSIDD